MRFAIAIGLAASVGGALLGCSHTPEVPKLPKFRAGFGVEAYPADRRGPGAKQPWRKIFRTEGRALVQFRLTDKRESYDMHLFDSEVVGSWPEGADRRAAAARIHNASGVIGEVNASSFDPNDHTVLVRGTVYRVTVIFCVKPENCSHIPLYPNSTPLTIVAPPDDPEFKPPMFNPPGFNRATPTTATAPPRP